MTLLEPGWLVLLLPLAMALWWWRQPTRLLLALRIVLVVAVVLAMARPILLRSAPGGNLVVVVDRSRSLPADSERLQQEIIARLRAGMDDGDRLAVVSFAESAALEGSLQPAGTAHSGGFSGATGRERSDLAAGLQLALSVLPVEETGRLLVLSDGRWTGSDPLVATERAAARGVAIDSIELRRDSAGDLAVERFEAPPQVTAGEAFMIAAWVRSPLPQEVSFVLRRGDQVVAEGHRQLDAGSNRLLLRDRSTGPGTLDYRLELSGADPDPVPESNRGRVLVTARGRPRLLHLSSPGASGLGSLLRRTGLEVDSTTPAAVEWSLAGLASYSGLLLEDVPVSEIGGAGLTVVDAWVRSGAGGLLVTGGRRSYALGGYYRSPIDPLLPVSMELRQEHRKLALAVVVALDRSGSMAMEASGGRTKMDLANLAAAEVAGMLTPLDELGVVAVDSQAHIVSPLARVDSPEAVRGQILSIDSMGGGIFVYEALSTAAAMLAEAEAGTRHILLFADAADSEEPGRYIELLQHCRQAGITVSVVGLGTRMDSDAGLLQDIAARGGGSCSFTVNPEELPRLFAQDTFVVARSTFIEERTSLSRGSGLPALTGSSLPPPPAIDGYNLCYLRPGALVGLVSEDDYHAPIVAAWNADAGRVACYTGEADGAYTGGMASWSSSAELFAGLARWIMGNDLVLPPQLLVTQQVVGGVQQIRLHLDPEQGVEALSGSARVSVTQEHPDGGVSVREEELHWLDTDTMGSDIELSSDAAAQATVHLDGLGRQALAPVCLPVSPELVTAEGTGTATLERLARITGGTLRLHPGELWHEIPGQQRPLELSTLLLPLAVLLLVCEVLERRTGLVHHLARRLFSLRRVPSRAQPDNQPQQAPAQPHATEPTSPEPQATGPSKKPAPEPQEPQGSILDALEIARSRKQRRR